MAVMSDIKKLSVKATKGSKVETLTIGTIMAEIDFIDLQHKRNSG